LPKLSKLIEQENNIETINIQNKALELSLFLSVPAAIALLIASEPIISSLFGYGSFSEIGVKNSATALFYFAFGLPAFAIIKVFSSFFFARHETKIPFYISIVSVILNIIISIVFFEKIGFKIIPIATSISSWINAGLLYFFMMKKKYFEFNNLFKSRFPRVIFSSICMGVVLFLLLEKFSFKLNYDETFKVFYLLFNILVAILSYFLISFFVKAFKLSDIKLKY
jgi:putative peptidoglycan lipid II flippase